VSTLCDPAHKAAEPPQRRQLITYRVLEGDVIGTRAGRPGVRNQSRMSYLTKTEF